MKKYSFVYLLSWVACTVWAITTHWDAFFSTPTFIVSTPVTKQDASPAFYRESFVSQTPPESVHSAAAYVDSKNTLHAFWWGGSREGAKDVKIYTSTHADITASSTLSQWSDQSIVMTRQQASQDLNVYIKKLGNEVVFYDSTGRLWLFFVTVSAGGWATSHINATFSDNNGDTWSPSKRLYASRFLNFSHLVKCKPIEYTDGSIGLPAYHEMAGKFAVILHIDRDANVIDQSRISHGRYAIQPTILVESDTHATALMRSVKKDGVLISQTQNGGQTWSPITVSADLPNPNAGISGLTVSPNLWLLAYNHHKTGRTNLSLAFSTDKGQTWTKIHAFDQLQDTESVPYTHREFSYPWLMQDNAGYFHVFYTWHRHRIKHVSFNQAWLTQQLTTPSQLQVEK